MADFRFLPSTVSRRGTHLLNDGRPWSNWAGCHFAWWLRSLRVWKKPRQAQTLLYDHILMKETQQKALANRITRAVEVNQLIGHLLVLVSRDDVKIENHRQGLFDERWGSFLFRFTYFLDQIIGEADWYRSSIWSKIKCGILWIICWGNFEKKHNLITF